jgi:hypothetical protein
MRTSPREQLSRAFGAWLVLSQAVPLGIVAIDKYRDDQAVTHYFYSIHSLGMYWFLFAFLVMFLGAISATLHVASRPSMSSLNKIVVFAIFFFTYPVSVPLYGLVLIVESLGSDSLPPTR